MPKFSVGDTAYVPCDTFDELDGQPFALYRTTVQQVAQRSIRVSLPGGVLSDEIGSALVHKDLALAIFCIGDFQTEVGVLDPLAKSVLQYCRLLLEDGHVYMHKIRSLAELGKWFEREGNAYTHVIFIGHGSRSGIEFGLGGTAHPSDIRAQIEPHITSPKFFISLCCQTGYANFGRAFSLMGNVCRSLAAPFHSVHGAIASQFCQTFLAEHLLTGYSFGVAFNHARKAVPSNTSFRLWQAGKMTT